MDRLRMLRQLSLILVTSALAACGGDGSSDPFAGGGIGGSSSGTDTAEGGIGGSGSGTATGYGSVFINEIRHFQVADDATVTLDGVTVDPTTVNATDLGLPEGVTVDYVLGEDANDGLTAGTASALRAWHRVIGPVTGVAPLEVLGQPVQSTQDTSVDTQAGNLLANIDSLVTGDIVAVAGPADNDGVIRASRVAEQAVDPLQWQLYGQVQDYAAGAGTFSIGNQSIALGGVTPQACDTFADGQLVRVLAGKDAGFLPGDTLDTVLSVTCLEGPFDLLGDNAPAQVPATFEGIILNVGNMPDISVSGQRVNVANVVDLVFGRVGDLSVGTHIEVEGTLDTSSGTLNAERIIFLSPLVELTGPVEDAVAGASIAMLGLTVSNTAGTLDPDLVISNGDTSSTVSIKGFVAGFRDRMGSSWDNVVYAEEVVKADALADDSIYGPVNDTATDVITILGVDFNLNTANSINIVTLDDSVTATLADTEELIVDNGICLVDLLRCSNDNIFSMAASETSARAEGTYLLGSIDGALTLYPD